MKAYNKKRKPKHHIKPKWNVGEIPINNILEEGVEWFKNCQLIGRNTKEPKAKYYFFNEMTIYKKYYIITDSYKNLGAK